MKTLLKSLLLASLAASVFVIGTAHAAKTAPVNITSVSTGSSGNVLVKTDGTFVNPAGCPNSAYLILSDDPQLKNYLAILLTAQASGTTIVLTINDNDCINDDKNPKIGNIQLG